jgi:membrane fusion protein (multidrug efflux system)
VTQSKSAAKSAVVHDPLPLAPASQQASGQTVQFTPAKPAPVPGPQPVPSPPASPPPASAPATPPIVVKRKRSGATRFVVLVVVPLIALALGFVWWLHGGRYVTTDNAYVGADKVLITPQVSGPIVAVHVIEGQKVKTGEPLFDIDPAPYQIALSLAQGRLDAAKVEFANLRSSYVSNQDQIKMGQDAVDVRQADFDRKNALATHGSGTSADRDTSMAALIQARQILEFVRQQQATTMVKLGGSLDASIDTFPDYIQAKAGVEDAARNLRNTKILAPIDGVATQVAQIELGRVAPAGQPVFAVVANTGLWVDANPKESDLTYVREGLPATVSIDTFPDRSWSGSICSIAPGTGAQFAILPPQNASGNWVKVVQRVPLRFCFGPNEDTTNLRAGMSANLSIDTGRVRTLDGVISDLTQWVGGLLGRPTGAKAALVK